MRFDGLPPVRLAAAGIAALTSVDSAAVEVIGAP